VILLFLVHLKTVSRPKIYSARSLVNLRNVYEFINFNIRSYNYLKNLRFNNIINIW